MWKMLPFDDIIMVDSLWHVLFGCCDSIRCNTMRSDGTTSQHELIQCRYDVQRAFVDPTNTSQYELNRTTMNAQRWDTIKKELKWCDTNFGGRITHVEGDTMLLSVPHRLVRRDLCSPAQIWRYSRAIPLSNDTSWLVGTPRLHICISPSSTPRPFATPLGMT